ncbi:MAG: hypothetical protein Kow0031_18160 [Anaerolineae bacterium]
MTKSAVLVRATILLLLLLAFALRLHNIELHSLWYDELLELDIASGPLVDIGPQLRRHAAMPLDYYLLHGWLLLGRQEMWVRWPALLFGTLTVALTFALGQSMFNRRVALVAAALLAGSFFAVRYSQEVRPYAMLTFFAALTFWGVWLAVTRQRVAAWGLALAGITGATLSHYFAIFLLPSLALFVTVRLVLHPKQKAAWLNLIGLGGVLAAVLLVFVLNGRFWILYSVGERFAREAAQPQLYTLPAAEKPNRGDGPPLTLDFFRQKILEPLAAPPPPLMALYLLFFGVAVGAIFAAPPRRRDAVGLLLAWALLPALLIYLFLLHRGTFFATRYILYTLPPFLLLVAVGLETSLAWGFRRFSRSGILPPPEVVRAAAAISLLLPLLLAQLVTLQQHYAAGPYEDWRAVGDLLRRNASPADAVIAVKAEQAVNWYYPEAAQPAGTFGRSAPIWEAIRNHPRRWFVLNSYSFKQDQGLRDWLQQRQAVKLPVGRRITIYYLEEGLSGAEMLARAQEFWLPSPGIKIDHY